MQRAGRRAQMGRVGVIGSPIGRASLGALL
jgi:hypothetical protein